MILDFNYEQQICNFPPIFWYLKVPCGIFVALEELNGFPNLILLLLPPIRLIHPKLRQPNVLLTQVSHLLSPPRSYFQLYKYSSCLSDGNRWIHLKLISVLVFFLFFIKKQQHTMPSWKTHLVVLTCIFYLPFFIFLESSLHIMSLNVSDFSFKYYKYYRIPSCCRKKHSILQSEIVH